MLEGYTSGANHSPPEGPGLEAHDATGTIALTGMHFVYNNQWPARYQV